MTEEQREITNTTEKPNEHLLRAIRITGAARFHAAKRLRAHEKWSLWSISLASLFILIISLLQPFKIIVQIPDNIIQLSQVVASVVILIVSFFVNGNKYGERAEKMHTCALELNVITREIETAIFHNDDQVISDLRKRYEETLTKYENHSDADYFDAKLRKAQAFYKIGWFHRKWAKALYYAEFIPYSVLIISAILVLLLSILPMTLTG